jgi:hypothetical protein
MGECDKPNERKSAANFCLPGGSMGPRYVLQLLFSEILQDCFKTQQPLKLEKK